MGLIKYRLWYQETINLTDKLDRKNQIVYRKGSPEIELYKDIGETDKKKDKEKEDDKTKDDNDKNPNDDKVDDDSKGQNETQQSKNDTNVKINWDNETIYTERPWYNHTLFEFNGFQLTSLQAAVGFSTFVIVSIVVLSICCVVSIWQRKAIRSGAHRVSMVIVRASIAVRDSIRKSFGRGQDP